jgi:hypothetical protein
MRAKAATAGAVVLAIIALGLLGVGGYVGTHLFDEYKTEDAEWLIVLLTVVPLALGLVCLGAAVAAFRART